MFEIKYFFIEANNIVNLVLINIMIFKFIKLFIIYFYHIVVYNYHNLSTIYKNKNILIISTIVLDPALYNTLKYKQ